MRSGSKVMDVPTLCSKPQRGEKPSSLVNLSAHTVHAGLVCLANIVSFGVGETSEVTQCHDIELVSESGASTPARARGLKSLHRR